MQIAAIKKFRQAQLQLSVKSAANMDTDCGGKTTAEPVGVLLSVCVRNISNWLVEDSLWPVL